jgi:hypothetical protein
LRSRLEASALGALRGDIPYALKAAFGRGRLRAARCARRPRRPTPGPRGRNAQLTTAPTSGPAQVATPMGRSRRQDKSCRPKVDHIRHRHPARTAAGTRRRHGRPATRPNRADSALPPDSTTSPVRFRSAPLAESDGRCERSFVSRRIGSPRWRRGELVKRRRSGVHLRRADVGMPEERLGVLDPCVAGDVVAYRATRCSSSDCTTSPANGHEIEHLHSQRHQLDPMACRARWGSSTPRCHRPTVPRPSAILPLGRVIPV